MAFLKNEKITYDFKELKNDSKYPLKRSEPNNIQRSMQTIDNHSSEKNNSNLQLKTSFGLK